MKVLLLHARDYWLRPYEKSVPEAGDPAASLTAQDALLALVHVEPADPAEHAKRVTQGIKQIKWLAGKLGTRSVILHSFAHLATGRAEPREAEALLRDMQARLADAGYAVQVTPFGWFNEFRVHVAGPSLAKVFAEF